jgi:hypothetical protein
MVRKWIVYFHLHVEFIASEMQKEGLDLNNVTAINIVSTISLYCRGWVETTFWSHIAIKAL